MNMNMNRCQRWHNCTAVIWITMISYECHCVWNHLQLDCSFNILSKEIIKTLHDWSFMRGIHWLPWDSPHQGVSNVETISISWCHHVPNVNGYSWIPLNIMIQMFHKEILYERATVSYPLNWLIYGMMNHIPLPILQHWYSVQWNGGKVWHFAILRDIGSNLGICNAYWICD